MNRFLFFIVCLVCIILLSSCGSAIGDRNETKIDSARLMQHLIDLEKKSWQAWKSRDGSYFQNFLSDDHIEVGRSGVVGKKLVVDFVGSPACKVNSYSVSDFKMTMLDSNVAVLTYHATQQTICGDTVPSPAWTCSIYIKRGNNWLNAVYQQTPAK